MQQLQMRGRLQLTVLVNTKDVPDTAGIRGMRDVAGMKGVYMVAVVARAAPERKMVAAITMRKAVAVKAAEWSGSSNKHYVSHCLSGRSSSGNGHRLRANYCLILLIKRRHEASVSKVSVRHFRPFWSILKLT